jgi:hypothetical protein
MLSLGRGTRMKRIPVMIALSFGFFLSSLSFAESGGQKRDDVYIGPNVIGMPLGFILLVKRHAEYCAIRFTKFEPVILDGNKTAKHESRAWYESYYQGDGSGDFSAPTVKRNQDELIFTKGKGVGRMSFSFGSKTSIRCGPLEFSWSSAGTVYYHVPGGSNHPETILKRNITFAPTPWTSIAEINTADPRLVWYGYDESRPRISVSIGKLWDKNSLNDR